MKERLITSTVIDDASVMTHLESAFLNDERASDSHRNRAHVDWPSVNDEHVGEGAGLAWRLSDSQTVGAILREEQALRKLAQSRTGEYDV